MTKQKNAAAVALGTRGGLKTYAKHGKEHYEKMNRARWGAVDKSPLDNPSGRSKVKVKVAKQ